jgi:hypothetical protein
MSSQLRGYVGLEDRQYFHGGRLDHLTRHGKSCDVATDLWIIKNFEHYEAVAA